jgi:SAM-dependent methyltransferase
MRESANHADSRTRRAAATHLGVRQLEWPKILRMDARDLRFSDASFDFVYSRSVFQHITNPEAALHEIRRTLRPGGATHISLHLWTCPNGYTYVPAPNWEWPHLRGLAKPVDIDPSRNRLRLAEWQGMFDEIMPGTDSPPAERLYGAHETIFLQKSQQRRVSAAWSRDS